MLNGSARATKYTQVCACRILGIVYAGGDFLPLFKVHPAILLIKITIQYNRDRHMATMGKPA